MSILRNATDTDWVAWFTGYDIPAMLTEWFANAPHPKAWGTLYDTDPRVHRRMITLGITLVHLGKLDDNQLPSEIQGITTPQHQGE